MDCSFGMIRIQQHHNTLAFFCERSYLSNNIDVGAGTLDQRDEVAQTVLVDRCSIMGSNLNVDAYDASAVSDQGENRGMQHE